METMPLTLRASNKAIAQLEAAPRELSDVEAPLSASRNGSDGAVPDLEEQGVYRAAHLRLSAASCINTVVQPVR
jgi:hypothetical protein